MVVGVLKWHHPCFFVFVDFPRASGGFHLPDGFFYPFRFCDIFFALYGGFLVFLSGDMHYSNMLALSSSIDKRKIEDRTIDIECEATAM
jgi:hypothetical protein